MHPQLQMLVNDLDEALDRLHRLASQHGEAAWDERPEPGGWSASECVAHLNLTSKAYLRLLHDQDLPWESRSHLLGTAAVAMRRLLIDRARERQAQKRGGGMTPVELDEGMAAAADTAAAEVLALDQALGRLEAVDARLARVVELRFFGGLTVEEVAEALGVSRATVENDWTFAKAWLRRRLSQQAPA